MAKMSEIEVNEYVWVTHQITKVRKKCLVVSKSLETDEVQVTISEGCTPFKKCFDVEVYK
jgi:hypothetical protein